ncbi:MAG: glycosyltransferase family 39 protein [Flavobacteriales bacterium]|nr:glycosyltransferase family 39 protein [Flavobacteriales bacterium]
MFNQTQENKINWVYGLVALILVIKLCMLPFAQTVHSDAVARVFGAIDWMHDPHWIKSGVWAPFHFYLNGIALSIWNSPVYAPKLLNIVFSCLTLIPFFYFVRREFNENGALIATIFLAICPILFRNSFQALAGTSYLFFLVLSLNYLSKALSEKSFTYAAFAGLAISFAAGIRYEAWLLMMVYWLIIILKKEWLQSFIYGGIAVIFPVIWLITNWMETGDPMFGINGNYTWTLDIMQNNDSLNWESHLRRIWFFPFSLMIALGPPAAFITLKMIISSYKEEKSAAIWSIPFWIVFAFMIYNCYRGVLLIQHRFVGTLVVLALPFTALYFAELTVRKKRIAVVFGIITLGLTFIYNTDGVTPLPRLKNQDIVKIAQITNNQTDEESSLILDFIGWDKTYFIALNSGQPKRNITIAEGTKNKALMLNNIKNNLERFDQGIILLEHQSKLSKLLGESVDLSLCTDKNFQFTTAAIYNDKRYTLYKWWRK